eukprot:3449159-Rhodomonas_salina.3
MPQEHGQVGKTRARLCADVRDGSTVGVQVRCRDSRLPPKAMKSVYRHSLSRVQHNTRATRNLFSLLFRYNTQLADSSRYGTMAGAPRDPSRRCDRCSPDAMRENAELRNSASPKQVAQPAAPEDCQVSTVD